MMLGKRQRGPIRRTASMKGINVDLNDAVEVSEPSDYPHQNLVINGQAVRSPYDGSGSMVLGGGPSGFDHRVMAMVSPRYNNNDNKRSAAGGGGGDAVVETANFLKTCGLCNRLLTTGRDIYMYRGDTAFCSQECREQQMKHDERKEKYSLAASKKDGSHRHHSSPNTATATATATVTSDVGLYIS